MSGLWREVERRAGCISSGTCIGVERWLLSGQKDSDILRVRDLGPAGFGSVLSDCAE